MSLFPGITEDAFLDGRLRLRQPSAGYRAAIDPVLLAAAVPAAAGQRVIDLGCGVATASLCLLARVSGLHVTGLELQADLADLAHGNAQINGREAQLRILCGDVAAPPPVLRGEAFDHVMMNPPYLEPQAARPSAHAQRRVATVEGPEGLAAWFSCALGLLRDGGSLTVIHRADRLQQVLGLLAEGCGDTAVFPLWPRQGAAAKRVLVRARKGSAAPLRCLTGLVLHHEDGGYTPAAEAVLRRAVALEL